MRNKHVICVIALCAALFPASAQADGARYYDYIYKIQVGEDEFLYVNVLGNFSADHGCSTPFYARSQHPLTDERTKAMLHMSTASYLSRTRVYVVTRGCTPAGNPIMVGLQLEQ